MITLRQISQYSLKEEAQMIASSVKPIETYTTDYYVIRRYRLSDFYAEVWFSKELPWSGVLKIRYLSQ